MRCLIVDDELPAREGMRNLLLTHPGVEVVGEADSVEDALRLSVAIRPGIVFLDVQLRGETGFDFLRRLEPPIPQIVFVTAHDRFAVEAFRVDAVDYLLKPINPAQLAEALLRATLRSRVAEIPAPRGADALVALGLTAREAEVLFWLAQGKSNPQIASILKNSPGTVKKQVQSILARLKVDSRVSAALRAAKILGLRTP